MKSAARHFWASMGLLLAVHGRSNAYAIQQAIRPGRRVAGTGIDSGHLPGRQSGKIIIKAIQHELPPDAAGDFDPRPGLFASWRSARRYKNRNE